MIALSRTRPLWVTEYRLSRQCDPVTDRLERRRSVARDDCDRIQKATTGMVR
jgi:hypothetical protein